jgi:predicted ribosomally synthesized peptide with SipW-like signal peptide
MKFRYSILSVIGVAIIAAIGFTVAYLSDTEKSDNNVFSAGTLDLSIGEPVNAVWQTDNWMPGDEVEGELELKNSGSLPIKSLIMTVEIE